MIDMDKVGEITCVDDMIMRNLIDESRRIRKHNPELFEKYSREQFGMLNGDHYTKEYAEHDVEHLEYTDEHGTRHYGAHWTPEQVERATSSLPFGEEVTRWDKFVAFNVMYSDTCKVLTEDQIIRAAHQFFFSDEDFAGENKIWSYMMMTSKAKDSST